MKLKVRSTLNSEEVDIDVETSATIESLKSAATNVFPDFEPATVKLIWKGKILGNDKSVSDFPGIKDGESLVIVGRKKTAPKPEKGAADEPTLDTSQTATPAPAPTLIPPSYESAASSFVSGELLEKTIQEICEMGFERPAVVRAMEAAFNNPDRAVDFLTNGMPIQAAGQSGGQEATQGQPMADEERAMMQEQLANFMIMCANRSIRSPETFEELRAHPLMLVIREVCRQEPGAIADILQFIEQISPELLRDLEENRAELLQLLAQRGPSIMAPEDNTPFPCTAEEASSIERLQALGFQQMAVIEAFVACDRNEELAANYLLENAADYMYEDEAHRPVDDNTGGGGGDNPAT